jgi:hypothetical protein
MARLWGRLGLVATAHVAVFGDFLVRGRILLTNTDDYVYYLPVHILAARAWRAGHLPAWDPYAFGGYPLMATGQAGVFYPPNLVFLVLSPVVANNLITILNFVVAGIGAFLLARRLTDDDNAALVGGLAFSLSGFMFGHVAHQSISATISWLPWALYAFELLRERMTPLRLLLGGGAVALSLFGGHGQMFFFVVLVVGLYALVLTVPDWRANRGRPVLVAGAMVGVGVGLAAIQLLPTLAILHATDRSTAFSYETATSYSFPRSHLPLFIFPYLFGNAAPSGPFTASYQGLWSLAELNNYPSMAALALAAAGLGAARRDRRVLALAGVGVVGLLMAMGGSTPLGRLIYALPVLGGFRSWARYGVALDLAVAILAAYGMAFLRTSSGPARRAALLRAAAVPVGAGLIAVWVHTIGSSRHFTVGGRTGAFAVGLPMAAALAGAGCCLLLARRVRLAAVAAIVIVALDAVFSFGAFFEWRGRNVPVATVNYVYSRDTPPAYGPIADQPGGIDRFLFASSDIFALPGETPLTDVKGLRSLNGYDVLAPKDYLQVMGRMNYFGAVSDPSSFWPSDSRILDLLRVTTVLVDPSSTNPMPDATSLVRDGRPVPGTRLVRYEYRPRLPDVFVVGDVRRKSRTEVLAGLSGWIPFDPAATALVEDDCGCCAAAVQPGSVASIEEVRWETSSVHVDLTAQRAGLLVVSQGWFPGWKASVDGHSAPVLRTDGIVQGVPVDAGFHRVKLYYQPPGLRTGMALTLGTLAILGVAAVRARRRGVVGRHRVAVGRLRVAVGRPRVAVGRLRVAVRSRPVTGAEEGDGALTGADTAEPAPPRTVDDRPRAPTAPWTRWTRWLPLVVVGGVCLFNLVVLRAETAPAQNVNDSAFHLQMVRSAGNLISAGRVPLDGWYPYMSLGASQFHHYQTLSHTLTAYLSHLFGGHDETAYLWLQYLLLALWPVSVFWGARLLGWGRWPAAAAALVSPLVVSTPGYGYEHGSYTWQGLGVYPQLWAMWALPLAWGFTWRAVSQGRAYAAAALAVALTIATHFMAGYLALVTAGVWGLLLWHGLGRRVVRLIVLVAGSALTASWVLIPLLADREWSAQSEFFKGTFFNDSYGARRILEWLFTGRLFDAGRFPILTLLVGVGIVVCLTRLRGEERARALVGAFIVSLLLFFGRPTLGPLTGLLPGNVDLQFHRFIAGVHLAGILLAGVGLASLCGAAARLVRSRWEPAGASWWKAAWAPAVIAATVAGVLAPAWTALASYDRRDGQLIPNQRFADQIDGVDLGALIDEAKGRGGGRFYAGLRANWGRSYTVGHVPVYTVLANADADAIGFTFRAVTSMSTDVEAVFDETNPAQYQLLNVRYLLLPADRPPSVPATLLDQRGRHRLWEVRTSGYFQVVDRIGSVIADRTNLASASRTFMTSDLATREIYPSVAFAGGQAADPTVTGATPPPGPPGSVISQLDNGANGVFVSTVQANRPAVVLLKASYDPRWTVTVDGARRQAVMMAPSLVGVDVPPGRHDVEFRYVPYPHYPLLIAVGLLTLAALALVPRRQALVRLARELLRRAPPAPSPTASS